MPFSFGFHRHLSNRETMEVTSLLSLLDMCTFRVGRRDVHIWILMKGFLLNPSSNWYWMHSSLRSVFDVIWRIKIPKVVMFFICKVLFGRMNTIDRLVWRRTSLACPFCCILWRKSKEKMGHFLWDCQYLRTLWSFFLQDFEFRFVGHI